MQPNPPARRDRTLLWVALVFVIAWVAYLTLFGPRRGGSSPLSKGQPAAYQWTLQDLDGAPVSFERFRGKAVFLNLWATWCGPCVAEMPSIARLAANPKLQGVAFVCVSIDDDLEPVRQFVRDRKLHEHLTILRVAGPVPEVFQTDAIPATFLIAPDGRIARREIGSMEWDSPSHVATLMDLNKARPAP